MTFSYAVRLMLVCLASLTIVVAATGLAISAMLRPALELAERLSARCAARLTILLRFLPACAGALMVLSVCVPSFIRFEQRDEVEEAGWLCLVLAAVAAVSLVVSWSRAVSAWMRSRGAAADFAVAGILRARVMISPAARRLLSESQLAVAIGHEEAHARAFDNLKRLLMLLVPAPFPGFSELERAWKRFAEYAADDRATEGDDWRRVSLAGALIQIAKLQCRPEPALVTSFLAAKDDLHARVERLLTPRRAQSARWIWILGMVASVAAGWGILHPGTPEAAHNLLERLMH